MKVKEKNANKTFGQPVRQVNHVKYRSDPDTYMQVSMMHIYIILDPEACVYDAGINDAYIHDP